MHIASGIAMDQNPVHIVRDLHAQLTAGMPDAVPDLLVLFVTAPLQPHFERIAADLRAAINPRIMIGCTAESVLGSDREIERAPAVSALLMSMPGVVIDTFYFADEEWPELLNERGTLQARLEAGDDLRAFLMLGDPFSTPVVQLLDACSALFPQAPIFGGMASNAQHAGDTRMVINDQIFFSGLVGASLAGKLQIDTVVSQGCRPIGETYVITKGQRNVIAELGGKPSLQVIQDMISALPILDRNLLESNGLFIGRVIDEGKGSYGRGDFLVRNLLDVRRDTGAIAIGDLVRPGQTVQFHVRDAATAEEDLRLLLEGELQLAKPPAGALLFTCNGRGTRLFENPNHEVNTIRSVLGPVPIAGFFCAGELGPVGQRNFIHGQTASLALFRPLDDNPQIPEDETMLEIEAKIKVDSLEPIRQKLIALKAQRLHAVTQTNIFFDRPDRSLLAADSGLRLRLETSPEFSDTQALFTFKGPRQHSPLRPRESFDLSVIPVADAASFLQALGFQQTLSFEKHRESFLYASCRVELDELPHLGTFVEIEGPSAEAVNAVRSALLLDQHELVRDSYVAMMARYVDDHNIADRKVVFPT